MRNITNQTPNLTRVRERLLHLSATKLIPAKKLSSRLFWEHLTFAVKLEIGVLRQEARGCGAG
ncbi:MULTISPECIES: hypothetical protein, partial [unclassified Microcoleus]|uniref:hypothetical protein n=1 Tax=unclassified Microcoleus TaxID=2642155 RepID=UPI002FD39BB4